MKCPSICTVKVKACYWRMYSLNITTHIYYFVECMLFCHGPLLVVLTFKMHHMKAHVNHSCSLQFKFTEQWLVWQCDLMKLHLLSLSSPERWRKKQWWLFQMFKMSYVTFTQHVSCSYANKDCHLIVLPAQDLLGRSGWIVRSTQKVTLTQFSSLSFPTVDTGFF